jgi:transglutaminase-like putative cysteine protease
MRFRSIKLVSTLAVLLCLPLFLNAIARAASDATPPDRQRDFRFTYHSEISLAEIGGIAPMAKHVEAWIPLPREDAFQHVTALEVDTPVHHEIVDQNHNGNRVLHLDASAPLPASIPVTVRFEVKRIEEAPNLQRAQRNVPEPSGGKFAEFLGPDRLVPLSGRIAQVSDKLGDETAAPYQQAQIIYEYVVSVMSYDKTGTGWGRGDALYACDVRRGNCTDFHSLFIALARSRGIPARFTIGFPIGAAKSGQTGQIPGYHCWAEFYAGGEWVPLDASEAWKNPARHAYYFGHLDAARVAFTMGRDLALTPRQQGEPLNYLIYPYVEVDGKPLPKDANKNHFEYANVAE